MAHKEHHDQLHRCLQRAFEAAALDPEPRWGFVVHALQWAHRERQTAGLRGLLAATEKLGDPETPPFVVLRSAPARLVLALQACCDIVDGVTGECEVLDLVGGIAAYLVVLRACNDVPRVTAIADALVRAEGQGDSFTEAHDRARRGASLH